ncbi:MAG: hypothetical protein AB7E55_33220 [Pigmentiphaga sp.]
MTRFEKIALGLLSLQLLATVLFAWTFFGLIVDQFVELRVEVSKIGWEVYKQTHPLTE